MKMKKIKPSIGWNFVLPTVITTITMPVASMGFCALIILSYSDNAEPLKYLLETAFGTTEGRIFIAIEFIVSFLGSIEVNTCPSAVKDYEKKKQDYEYHQITWDEYTKDKQL